MERINCFASDNTSGVDPRIMAALARASEGFELSYGYDKYTQEAEGLFHEIFGNDSEVYFVYNGTGANTLALGSLTRSWQAVICSSMAHINVDETGAPEKFTGCKLMSARTMHGKLTPGAIEEQLHELGFEHSSQPAVVSLTNATEEGTIYTTGEIAAIAETAHRYGLKVHMDGARIANAAVAIGKGFAAITRDCGVDVLSFGGTKNGLMFGEAVVFMHKTDGTFKYLRKHGTQLHSKMRFIAAQYIAYLSSGLWEENAQRANALAQKLVNGLKLIPDIEIAEEVQVNGVFVHLPPEALKRMEEKYFFYSMQMDGGKSAHRLMCSFNTPENAVDELLALARG